MPNTMSNINIAVNDQKMSGYLALPIKTPAPGIIILQEIFGVNQVMRDICDHWAEQGFAALCPDLFWRIEPGIDITDQTKQEWEKAFDLFGKFNVDQGVDDIAAAIKTLRSHGACNGAVCAVGFCLGGQLAYLTAARTDIDAAIGYYGVNIQNLLNEAENITKPLMLHIAGKDQFVPQAAQKEIIQALEPHAQITLHLYPDRDHAFARQGGEHYHKQDAEQANQKSLAFLRAALS